MIISVIMLAIGIVFIVLAMLGSYQNFVGYKGA